LQISIAAAIGEILLCQQNLRDLYVKSPEQLLVSIHQQILADSRASLTDNQTTQANSRQIQSSGAKSYCAGRDQHNLATGISECGNRAHYRLNLFGGYLTVRFRNDARAQLDDHTTRCAQTFRRNVFEVMVYHLLLYAFAPFWFDQMSLLKPLCLLLAKFAVSLDCFAPRLCEKLSRGFSSR